MGSSHVRRSVRRSVPSLRAALAVASCSALLALAAACGDEPVPGARGGPCRGDLTCDQGLACSAESRCVPAPPVGPGDAGPGDAGRRDAGPAGPDAGGGPDAGPAPDGGTGASLEYRPPTGCFRAAPTVRQLERRSLAASAAGVVHLAIGGDALYYGRREPGASAVAMELVDVHGGPASVALDPAGEPVIAYFDRFRRSTVLAPEIEGVKVARRVEGRWRVAEVWAERRRPRRTQDDDPAPAVTVDARGLVHLAMKVHDGAGADAHLEVMTWDGAALERARLALPSSPGYSVRNVELHRDAAGEPVLLVDTWVELWLVRHGASGWLEPERVTREAGAGGTVEWAGFVDGAGRPGLVLRGTETGQRVAVWRQTATGWDRVTCAPGTSAPFSGAYQPAVLPDGTPIFAARRAGPGSAQLATVRVGETCVVEDVVEDVPAPLESIEVDDEQVLHGALGFAAGARVRALLRFLPTGAVLLEVSDDDGGSYRSLPVLESRVHGLAPAIAALRDGRPVIASVEQVRGALELSTFDPATRRFVTEELPLGPGRCRVTAGRDGAVQLLAAGDDLLVSFRRACDGGASGRVVARRSGAGWTELPSPGIDAPIAALALQPDGRPALASPGAVYAFDGGGWITTPLVAGPGTDPGVPHPTLAFDGAGRPVVGYTRGQSLVVAQRTPDAGWLQETVDGHSNHLRTLPARLRVDAAGVQRLAYGRYAPAGDGGSGPGPTELRIGTRDATGWRVELLARLGWEGEHVPLEGLDLDLVEGRPVVVYRSTQLGALVLTALDARGAWDTRALADDGDTGLYPAVVAVGRTAHVAFHHGGTGDLCYLQAEVR